MDIIYIWLLVMVGFAIIEVLTVGLTTIWFAAGALGGAISAALGCPIWIQLTVFLAISILLLLITRPLLVDKLNFAREKTNVDSLIGKTAIITRPIEAFSTGQAKVDGQIWTVVSKDNQTIEKNCEVKILQIEGVKLIVEKL